MTAYAWLTFLACAGLLSLTLLSTWRAARHPLGTPLSMLSVTLLSWNLFSLGYELSGARPEWRWLVATAAPLTNPAALHFVLTFVGRRRALARLLAGAYLLFGLFSALSLLAFFSPTLGRFAGSASWALAHGVLTLPITVTTFGLLSIHLGRATNPDERINTWLLLVALLWITGLGSADSLIHLGLSMPRLASVAALGACILLGAAALRLNMFGHGGRREALVFVLLPASLAVLASYAVFGVVGTSLAAFLGWAASMALALVVIGRRFFSALSDSRARMSRLTTLGRFSTQMSHDLKNPLAAIKGAAQYLEEASQRGATLQDEQPYVKLIGDQVERLTRVVEHYERLGRVEPAQTAVSLHPLFQALSSPERVPPESGVSIRMQLEETLPPVLADPDLLERALENLVHNALEAMPDGGALTLRAELDGDDDHGGVSLYVEDTGTGMEPRTLERATDEFFTTKARGSGLGLAFARRVAESHGGALHVSSKPGKGTSVCLRLPSVAPRSHVG